MYRYTDVSTLSKLEASLLYENKSPAKQKAARVRCASLRMSAELFNSSALCQERRGFLGTTEHQPPAVRCGAVRCERIQGAAAC
jgi:hypothetical protein